MLNDYELYIHSISHYLVDIVRDGHNAPDGSIVQMNRCPTEVVTNSSLHWHKHIRSYTGTCRCTLHRAHIHVREQCCLFVVGMHTSKQFSIKHTYTTYHSTAEVAKVKSSAIFTN